MTIKPVISTSNIQFDLSNIGTFPPDILYYIFSKVVNYKDIHSLWSTCHHFRWAISEWTPFWTTLLDSHFPGSYTPSPGVKPIDVYNGCLELENAIKSWENKLYVLFPLNELRCIIEHKGNLIAATKVNIEIWKDEQWQRLFPLQNGEFVERIVAYEDTLFVVSKIADGNDDSMINVYDLNNGKFLKNLESYHGQVSDLCKIKNKLYSCSDDGNIKIWDMDTLEFIQTLKGHTKEDEGVRSLLPHEDTLYAGSSGGRVEVWNLNTYESAIFHDFRVWLDVCKMLIHGNKFISILNSETTPVIDLISKRALISILDSPDANDILGFGRLLFSAKNNGVSMTLWDLNTGKTLMTFWFRIDTDEVCDDNDYVSSPSMVFSQGKLYVASGMTIYVFDFAETIRYKKKLGWLEALQLAIAQENRNEIIACVDNFIATDPKNKEFCEFLCQITQGEDIRTYEFLFNRTFDYREILRTASFYHIKKAADKFTEKLKIDQNIVVEEVPSDQFHHIIESEGED